VGAHEIGVGFLPMAAGIFRKLALQGKRQLSCD
jgi:hypothetical protein